MAFMKTASKSEFVLYRIWRRQSNDRGLTEWSKTYHSVMARSDKEAESRLKRKFGSCGFRSMQLVAVPENINPNEGT